MHTTSSSHTHHTCPDVYPAPPPSTPTPTPIIPGIQRQHHVVYGLSTAPQWCMAGCRAQTPPRAPPQCRGGHVGHQWGGPLIFIRHAVGQWACVFGGDVFGSQACVAIFSVEATSAATTGSNGCQGVVVVVVVGMVVCWYCCVWLCLSVECVNNTTSY